MKSYDIEIVASGENYVIQDTFLKYEKSEVCLESSYMDQMNFIGDLKDNIVSFVENNLLGKSTIKEGSEDLVYD